MNPSDYYELFDELLEHADFTFKRGSYDAIIFLDGTEWSKINYLLSTDEFSEDERDFKSKRMNLVRHIGFLLANLISLDEKIDYDV